MSLDYIAPVLEVYHIWRHIIEEHLKVKQWYSKEISDAIGQVDIVMGQEDDQLAAQVDAPRVTAGRTDIVADVPPYAGSAQGDPEKGKVVRTVHTTITFLIKTENRETTEAIGVEILSLVCAMAPLVYAWRGIGTSGVSFTPVKKDTSNMPRQYLASVNFTTSLKCSWEFNSFPAIFESLIIKMNHK